MATATLNVSGQSLVQVLLTANLTNLTLTNALDGQVVTLEFQQNGTGGFTVVSSSIPSLVQPATAANAVSSQTFQYTALTNTWTSVPTVGAGGAPQTVFVQNGSLGFAVFNSAAAVTMVPAGGPAGTYRFTLYGITTTTFVTNTNEIITLGFTDDNASATVAWTSAALTAGTKLPPVSSTVSNSVTFRSTGTAAITYTPSASGTSTAGAMAVSVILERLA